MAVTGQRLPQWRRPTSIEVATSLTASLPRSIVEEAELLMSEKDASSLRLRLADPEIRDALRRQGVLAAELLEIAAPPVGETRVDEAVRRAVRVLAQVLWEERISVAACAGDAAGSGAVQTLPCGSVRQQNRGSISRPCSAGAVRATPPSSFRGNMVSRPQSARAVSRRGTEEMPFAAQWPQSMGSYDRIGEIGERLRNLGLSGDVDAHSYRMGAAAQARSLVESRRFELRHERQTALYQAAERAEQRRADAKARREKVLYEVAAGPPQQRLWQRRGMQQWQQERLERLQRGERQDLRAWLAQPPAPPPLTH